MRVCVRLFCLRITSAIDYVRAIRKILVQAAIWILRIVPAVPQILYSYFKTELNFCLGFSVLLLLPLPSYLTMLLLNALKEISFCFHVFIVHYASLTHRTGTRVAHARGINAGLGRGDSTDLPVTEILASFEPKWSLKLAQFVRHFNLITGSSQLQKHFSADRQTVLPLPFYPSSAAHLIIHISGCILCNTLFTAVHRRHDVASCRILWFAHPHPLTWHDLRFHISL